MHTTQAADVGDRKRRNERQRERVLECLASGAVEWRTPTQIAEAIGLPRGVVADALCVLSIAGLVQVRPPESAVCLSPLGAESRGVRVDSDREAPRWTSCNLQQKRPRISSREAPTPRSLLGSIPDRQPGPAELAEAEEQRQLKYQSRFLPDRDTYPEIIPAGPSMPRVILGIGAPWNGPDGRQCPACRGTRLKKEEYCARCDNWGFDPCPTNSNRLTA